MVEHLKKIRVDNDGVLTDVSLLTKGTIDAKLALKADTSTVNTALALKADTSTVNTALALKVDKVLTIIGLDLQNNILLGEFKTALGNATQAFDGLMSNEDKAHLDNLVALLNTDDVNDVVNTIGEILEIFQNFPEGANLLDVLATKVDKEAGKTLSTNDLTDILKDHYDTAYTHSQIVDSNPHETTYAQLLNKPTTVEELGVLNVYNKEYIDELANEVTITNDDTASIPLTVNAIVGTTANIQSWQVNGVNKAYIDKDGNGSFNKLFVESGDDNIAIGASALNSLTTGIRNVAIGTEALKLNTSGQWNTAVGWYALHENIVGYENTAIGKGALRYNKGHKNTALGHSALSSNTTGGYNTAVGWESLMLNTEGRFNTAVGYEALRNKETGDYNIALGYSAGKYYGTGLFDNLTNLDNSIFIGRDTKASANGNTNEIVIGYEALGNGSNTATIGNSSLTGLYLGSATAKLYGLVDYDNTTSGLEAETVQDAIDEVVGVIDDLDATDVGLGNVTNESKATMFTSPAFTGTPTAPTAAAGTNTTQIATTEFVKSAISSLVASSPEALDTLNELAAALGDDPNFATTVANDIGAKVTANTAITGATKTKITYDAKGLVTAGADLQASDLPTHSHTKSDISDFPASLPASDVSAWAKAATKPSYISSEIGYDNTTSGLTATTVKGALDEVVEMVGDIDLSNLNEVTITNDDIASVPLTVNAVVGTTANLLNLQVDGVNVASVSKTGVFTGNGLDIGGGILHYGQELFRQVWNISSIDTIYSDITTLPSGQGNGTVLPALTGGALPLKLYEYNSTLAEWVYLVAVRSHTLYTVLATGKIYRYTMSSPYFIEMTNNYDNATSGLTATNQQGAIDELAVLVDGAGDHSLLINRKIADQHSIGSITDLTAQLAAKAPLIEPTFTNNAIGDVVATINGMSGQTANLLNLQVDGSNKLEVTKDGWLSQNGTRLLHTFSHPTGETAIPVGRNVFLGQEAGNLTMGNTATSTDHASYNVGIGYRALYSNTIGRNNTANGYQALYSNTTGLNNTANGYMVLRSNTTGSSNTTNGYRALYTNTTGSYNNANGVNALYANMTGSNNTANGYEAGRYYGSGTSGLTKINNSIFIGMNSRANADDETNEIVIGYEALGKGSNTATIGNSSLTGLYLGSATAKLYGLVDYDNTTSGLTATNTKEAIDEVVDLLGDIDIPTLNEVTITNDDTASIPLTVNAIAGTTAKLQSWQVNGVEKARVDSDGHFYDNGFYLQSNIINTNIVVSTWVADTTIYGYGYRATIVMTGSTANDIPYVHLSEADRLSGNYYEECESITNGIYVYSKVNTSITIPWAKNREGDII